MTLDLEKVMINYKRPITFDVKIAVPLNSEEKLDFTNLNAILDGKGMTNKTELKKLPFGSLPLCFKRLTDFVGDVYQCEMTFEYRMTSGELLDEISTVLQISRNLIQVTPANHPFLKDEASYLKYNEDEYITDAIATAQDNALADGIKMDSDYPEELAKTMQSKEAKAYRQGSMHEVDFDKVPNYFNQSPDYKKQKKL